ncbi:MAG: hypothetical protein ACUVRD_03045 [Bacteroidia bacterium]
MTYSGSMGMVMLMVPPGRDTIIAIARRLSPNGAACEQVYRDTFYVALPYNLTITSFEESGNTHNPKDTLDVSTTVGTSLSLQIKTTPASHSLCLLSCTVQLDPGSYHRCYPLK